MALALSVNAVLLAALLVLAAWLLTVYWGPLALVVLAGLGLAGGAAGGRRWRKYMLPADRAAPVERAIARLCLVADLDRPLVAVIADDTPLSWTTALPRARARVHVTTGVLELLDQSELDAVLAHELSHIGNRDATVMTVLAAPSTSVLRGLRAAGRAVALHATGYTLLIAMPVMLLLTVLAAPAFLSAACARVVSRHRELAADRGAALVTGSPAAMAAALRRLTDGLHAIPDRDLRVAAAGDVLHIVPARPAHGIARLWATHPPMAARLAQLDGLERRLQA
jgi:heat shock protein HtpX